MCLVYAEKILNNFNEPKSSLIQSIIEYLE